MSWEISFEADDHGRIARECPSADCSPGYFKVKFGTGITEEQEVAYCPYCRHEEEPYGFLTDEQERYMHEILFHETSLAVQNAMKDAFRGSKNVSFKPSSLPSIRSPYEDTVERNVVCPHCGLDHAVFGLAVWCPDCAKDIFMTHVEAEFGVVRSILGDVDRRREALGPRVGARDLENCLEDAVSIFEAVLKAMLIRFLPHSGEAEEEIDTLFSQRIRNNFQDPGRAGEIIQNRIGLNLFEGVPETEIKALKKTFEKRHPITHNLGVVDKKYIERAMAAELEGKDIRVTKEEIEAAISLCLQVLTSLHDRVFGK